MNFPLKNQTSTPCHLRKKFQHLKNQDGNLRVASSSLTKNKNKSNNFLQHNIRENDDNRQSKMRSGSRKVCFSSSTQLENSEQENSKENVIDASMMGYDWIAHMVDNESIVHHQSDDFFTNLKDFRDRNWEQCTDVKELSTLSKTSQHLHKLKLDFQEKPEVPLSCTGNGAYTVNNRCDLVPIHGPYSNCPICKKKPKCGPWCENQDVRVSIPKSKLESPYNLRPHRRKSFDPSQSVSLSSHCLSGWKNSKLRNARSSRSNDQGVGLSSEMRKTKLNKK